MSVGERVDAAVESVVHRSGDSAAWLWEAERVASGERVQVVVGDDHPMFRDGVVRALQSSGSIEVIAEVPDGPPQRFRWRRALHAVRLYEGPERIAAEWWRRRDNRGLTRDYYRVEDVQGRRYWLFRHGLYDEKTAPRWYIHGLFA